MWLHQQIPAGGAPGTSERDDQGEEDDLLEKVEGTVGRRLCEGKQEPHINPEKWGQHGVRALPA